MIGTFGSLRLSLCLKIWTTFRKSFSAAQPRLRLPGACAVWHFKNAGATWESTPALVKDHDFRTDALGIAIPWGLYDTQAN